MKRNANYYFMEVVKLLLMGSLIGVIIALYKYAASYVIGLSYSLITSHDSLKITLFVISLFILMFVSYSFIRLDGNIQGGGLPHLEMNISRKKGTIHWYKSLPLMFVNSLISLFCGLPLGSEAPSTFMGGTIGIMANESTGHLEEENDIGLGMGVGFGVAFMSPTSGICYAFEESLNKFCWKDFFKMILMMVVAYGVAYLINPSHIITINISSNYDWSYSYSLVVIIALCLPIALLIMSLIPKIKIFLNKHYAHPLVKYRFFILFPLLALAFLLYPLIGGTGGRLIASLYGEEINTVWWTLFLFLVMRIMMFFLAAHSEASGGLMLPTLTIGALVGGLINCLMFYVGMPQEQASLIILLSMIVMFALVNKTPFTGLFLIISIGGYQNIAHFIWPSLIVMAIVFILTRLIHIDNIIDSRRKLLRTSRKEKIVENE